MRLEGEYVRVREREVAELARGGPRRARAHGARARAVPDGRAAALLRGLRARLGGLPGGTSARSSARSARRGSSTRWLDRVWPAVAAGGARPRAPHPARSARGGGGRDPRRRGAGAAPAAARRFGWSEGDVRARRRGARAARRAAARVRARDRRRGAGPDADAAPRRARRASAGSLTLLGDIAQATGPVVHDRWGDVLAAIPDGDGGGRRGAPPCLPRPAGDHGPRAAAPRPDRARHRRRPSRSVPAGGHRASSRPRRTTSSAPRCARRPRARARGRASSR